MLIFIPHLLLAIPTLWTISAALEVINTPHSIQKRQLDWTGKYYPFDHVAVSSSSNRRRSVNYQNDQVHQEGYRRPITSSGGGLLGEPGIDYPVLASIPLTGFHCRGRVPGYYGDTATACQVFHVCEMGGRQDSFLCPNGTIFSQKLFACDWWYNVQCESTQQHYRLNRNLFRGSNINLYGTPSFWNWLSEVEEGYPAEQSVSPPPRSTAGRQYAPSTPGAAGNNNNWPSGAPASVPDLSVGDPDEDEGTSSSPYHNGWIDGFSWIDDAPTPSLTEDQANTAPQLAWTDLSPKGPSMAPGQFYQQDTRQGLVRRRKVRRRKNRLAVQQQQEAVKTRSTSTNSLGPAQPVIKPPSSIQERPIVTRPAAEEEPRQYYYYDEASGSFKPVEKLAHQALAPKSKSTPKYHQTSSSSIQPPLQAGEKETKPTKAPRPVPISTTTVRPVFYNEAITSSPIKPATFVRSTKVGTAWKQPDELFTSPKATPTKVFKSAGHKLKEPLMERVEPAFRPSKPMKSRPTEIVQTTTSAPPEWPTTKRKRSRQAIHSNGPATYDPKLDRRYSETHPIYRMANWESTKV